jgi:hypothetical protein
MANSTFNGPVRSENGFEQISVAAATGVVTTNFDIDASGNISSSGTIAARQPIITTWEASGAITSALTIAQSGSIVLIHGTLNNIINIPASSGANTGAYFDFLVTTAVGGATTTTIVIPTASGSTFYLQAQLAAGTAANPVITNVGDTFTFVANTAVGARCRIACVSDNGTGQVWMATSVGTPISTVA